MRKYIYLFVGRSGSGKNTIAEILHKRYDWSIVESYTTRPKRSEDEVGHIFVDKDTFNLPDKCAYTLFDEYEYCATSKQVDESDVYIIDPAGIDYFMEHYKGNKEPIAVWFDYPKYVLKDRLLNRDGETNETVARRMENDDKAFAHVQAVLEWYDELTVMNINNPNLSPFQITKMIVEYDRGLNDETDCSSC